MGFPLCSVPRPSPISRGCRARVWKMRPPRRRRWAGYGRVWTLRMAFIWRRRKAVRPSSALTRISPMPPTPSVASRCERPDRPVLHRRSGNAAQDIAAGSAGRWCRRGGTHTCVAAAILSCAPAEIFRGCGRYIGYALLGFGAWWGRHLHVVSLHRPLPVAIFLFDLGNDPEAAHWFGRLIGHSERRLPASGRLDGIFVHCLNLISVGVVQTYHLEHGLKMFEQGLLTNNRTIVRYSPAIICK